MSGSDACMYRFRRMPGYCPLWLHHCLFPPQSTRILASPHSCWCLLCLGKVCTFLLDMKKSLDLDSTSIYTILSILSCACCISGWKISLFLLFAYFLTEISFLLFCCSSSFYFLLCPPPPSVSIMCKFLMLHIKWFRIFSASASQNSHLHLFLGLRPISSAFFVLFFWCLLH